MAYRSAEQVSRRFRVACRGQGKRAPTQKELLDAILFIDRSGVADVIETRLNRRSDARSRLSVKLLLVAINLVAFEADHQMLIKNIAQIIEVLTPEYRRQCGSPDWDADPDRDAYNRVQRLFKQYARTLEEGWDVADPTTGEITRIDLDWYTERIIRSVIPDGALSNVAMSLDGTSMGTYARLHGDVRSVDLDGETDLDEENQALLASADAEGKAARHQARVLGIGPDGRKIWTTDSLARGGYQTATGKQKGTKFVGREVHIGVLAKPIEWTDGAKEIRFGETPPMLVVVLKVTPAGTHKAKAIMDPILRAHSDFGVRELIVDPGYSLAKPEYFHLPLYRAGIDLTMKPANHQRGEQPGPGGTRILNGQLFSAHTPDDLASTRIPDFRKKVSKRKATRRFDQLAAFRFSQHAHTKGGIRWIDCVRAGRVRVPGLPLTMRRPSHCPLLNVPDAANDDAINYTVLIKTEELPLIQPTIVGTTAWNKANKRRNRVESVNAQLKGTLMDIRPGYVQTLENAQILVAVAHTVLGYNRHALLQWSAVKAAKAEAKKKKAEEAKRKRAEEAKRTNRTPKPRKRRPRKRLEGAEVMWDYIATLNPDEKSREPEKPPG